MRPPPSRTALRTVHGVLLVASSLASATIGFAYATFYAFPELRAAVAEGGAVLGAAAHLGAALGFAIAQVVAIGHVLEDRTAFIAWLAPAACYLLAIGMVAWLRSGERLALWLDAARGLWLLALGLWHLSALRRALPGCAAGRPVD